MDIQIIVDSCCDLTPALNGEMCSSGAGSRRCCAVFSLPVEALFPRMAFRFCLLVHPYPL